MLYFANKLLNENQQKDLRTRLLSCSDWYDGAHTAKGSAKIIKRNLQLTSGETYDKLSEEIIQYITEDKVIEKGLSVLKVLDELREINSQKEEQPPEKKNESK